MDRVICLVIGYIFGLFQTGYIYGRAHGIDIRKLGSGNAGSTNALRTLGKKAGMITFLGDCFKCIFAVILVHLIFRNSDILPLLSMYAGFGAVLGHNYPFYLGFKGGKGIAVTAGVIISTTNVWIVLLCLMVFIVIVAMTKYVSVASLSVVTIYLISVIVISVTTGFAIGSNHLWEMYLIAGLFLLSAFYQHRENIKRLINGNENKISFGQK
ncbi:MAG TPA: glycerol-3-phosphate 1-O-acyltransferase PlsY [Candidatus Dorea intestinavium]|nr:glycerol-3-phosphate 1-O-acyltransferase PlsY [Candidatus Dorea intestinavium]